MTNSINPMMIFSLRKEGQASTLINAVNYSIKRLERLHFQLDNISRKSISPEVRRNAIQFLSKNKRLQTIAHDLLAKLNKLVKEAKNENLDSERKELLNQYRKELDVFDSIHFEVAKKQFVFVNTHYQAKVIEYATTAA